MEMQDKIDKLVGMCKGSVSITYNDHTTNYETVEDYLSRSEHSDVEEDTRKEMIKRGIVVEVHCYPDTPVGFYCIGHYDLGMALDEMSLQIEEDRIER